MPRRDRNIVHSTRDYGPMPVQRPISEDLTVTVRGRLPRGMKARPMFHLEPSLLDEFTIRAGFPSRARRIDIAVDDRGRYVAHIQGVVVDVDKERDDAKAKVAKAAESVKELDDELRRLHREDADAAGVGRMGPYSIEEHQKLAAARTRRLGIPASDLARGTVPAGTPSADVSHFDSVRGAHAPSRDSILQAETDFATDARVAGVPATGPWNADQHRAFRKAREVRLAREHGRLDEDAASDTPALDAAAGPWPPRKTASATVSVGAIGFDDEAKGLIRDLNHAVELAAKVVEEARPVMEPVKAHLGGLARPAAVGEGAWHAPIRRDDTVQSVGRPDFDPDSPDIIIALDLSDGVDWVRENLALRGHVALYVVGSPLDGRIIRRAYSTTKARLDSRFLDVARRVSRSIKQGRKRFLEPPLFDADAYIRSVEDLEEPQGGAAGWVAAAQKLAGVSGPTLEERTEAAKARQMGHLEGKMPHDPVERLDIESRGDGEQRRLVAYLRSGLPLEQKQGEGLTDFFYRCYLAATDATKPTR